MPEKEQTKEQPECGKALSLVSDAGNVTDKCHTITACPNETALNRSDTGLFGPFPPRPECPICFLVFPVDGGQSIYLECCGKTVCWGCDWENMRVVREMNLKRRSKKQPELEETCPFCRASPAKTDDERRERLQKRMNMNDAGAWHMMARSLFPKDERKAVEYYLRAVELGSIISYSELSHCYALGTGVPTNKAKATEYARKGTRCGCAISRHILGTIEAYNGNFDLAFKHYRFAAANGYALSLKAIKDGYEDGHVTKDDFAESLRAYQAARDEEKSEERKRVAALITK